MKNKKCCEITDRDYKILRFLWKWKIVSTNGLAKKFYPEADAFTAYRRLLYLESDGYIGHYPMGCRFNYAWVIKEKGFRYILPYLGDLRSKGYKSTNYPHDFMASAFHHGEHEHNGYLLLTAENIREKGLIQKCTSRNRSSR